MTHIIELSWSAYSKVWTDIELEVGIDLWSDDLIRYVKEHKSCTIKRTSISSSPPIHHLIFDTEQDLVEFKLKYL